MYISKFKYRMKILATAISAIQYNSFVSLDFPAAHLFIAKQLSNWKHFCFILSKGLCQCKNLLLEIFIKVLAVTVLVILKESN